LGNFGRRVQKGDCQQYSSSVANIEKRQNSLVAKKPKKLARWALWQRLNPSQSTEDVNQLMCE
jgi:hypothetical protein